jgi:hypothetical protein
MAVVSFESFRIAGGKLDSFDLFGSAQIVLSENGVGDDPGTASFTIDDQNGTFDPGPGSDLVNSPSLSPGSPVINYQDTPTRFISLIDPADSSVVARAIVLFLEGFAEYPLLIIDEATNSVRGAVPPGTYNIGDATVGQGETFNYETPPIPLPPVAADDTISAEQIGQEVDLLANDSDPNEGDSFSLVSIDGTAVDSASNTVDLASGARVTLNTNGTVTYTREGNNGGTDSFDYTIRDNGGLESTALVSVTLPNRAPTPPANGAQDLTDPAQDTITDLDLVTGATDDDTDDTPDSLEIGSIGPIDEAGTLQAVSDAAPEVTLASGAVVTVAENGRTVTYVRGSNNGRTDAIIYTVKDDEGVESAPATYTINFANRAPTAEADAVAVPEGQDSVTVNLITGDPENNNAGADSDPDADDTPDTLDIASIRTAGPGEGAVEDVTQGTPIALVSGATVTVNDAGEIVYDRGDNNDATDTFTYIIADEDGAASSEATVTVTLPNRAPVAVDDALTVPADSQTLDTIDLTAANGGDADSDPDTADTPETLRVARITNARGESISRPNEGSSSLNLTQGALGIFSTVTLSADGSVSYDRGRLADGTDSFTYQIEDDEDALSNAATATLTLGAFNFAPDAADDTLNVGLGLAAIFNVDLLANDVDTNGDDFGIVSLDGQSATAGTPVVLDPDTGAQVRLNSDGTITYERGTEAGRTDSFTYTVRDANGGESTANVTVQLAPLDPDRGEIRQATLGDELDDIGTDDVVVVTGVNAPLSPGAENVVVEFNEDRTQARIIVGENADQPITLNNPGGFSPNGDFMFAPIRAGADGADTQTQIRFIENSEEVVARRDPDQSVASEGVDISEPANGIVNDTFLTGDGSKVFTVTIKQGVSSFAGFDNSLGAYQVDAAGVISDVELLSANVKQPTGPITLFGGSAPAAGNSVGFFMIQDGARQISGLDTSDSFDFNAGLNAFDGGTPTLSIGGTAVSALTLHSFDALNPGGLTQVISGIEGDGSGDIFIGFEDTQQDGSLTGFPGVVQNADFFDLVFSVSFDYLVA